MQHIEGENNNFAKRKLPEPLLVRSIKPQHQSRALQEDEMLEIFKMKGKKFASEEKTKNDV